MVLSFLIFVFIFQIESSSSAPVNQNVFQQVIQNVQTGIQNAQNNIQNAIQQQQSVRFSKFDKVELKNFLQSIY